MSKSRQKIRREALGRRRIRRANARRIREEEELARYRSEEWERAERHRDVKAFCAKVAVWCTVVCVTFAVGYKLVRWLSQ